MKMNRLSILFGMITLLAGCQTDAKEESTPITGFVTDQKEDRILITESPSSKSNSNPRAVWVAQVPEKEWEGYKVKVWLEGPVQESYPEQAEGGKVKKVDVSRNEETDLTQQEALKKALDLNQSAKEAFAVESISYQPELDRWKIALQKIVSAGETVVEEIPDQ
ncbi:YobA family protein [Halobacillus salinarum]|uniref:YobA family protein n=1 Tax=Halobacillus salinarum TaxID=2932257 RepID=A0ABY4EKV4_9BACI|nr:DUF3221 domain-containing protein [Halobacillus salinarum]UOQ45098.1 YobA family protein [Halobacillus salinarum]